ncbi:MAG: exopolyphosphatase [Sphingobacteriales bacterium]|nr:MAG: exopolyphosphatase [Sphingobacteriales bacterium]
MNFAAIDIGSNAVRLLFSTVTDGADGVSFHKASLFRMPVRLGSDSFKNGEISKERRRDLVKTMIAYKHLIDVFKVEDYMACATSALREADNAKDIVDEIREEAGIELTVIDGELEAELIYLTHIAEDLPADRSYLYIDVGGGSTELTLFRNNNREASKSFKVGTVRLLENLVEDKEWKKMEDWIDKHAIPSAPVMAIGTGGNINKIHKIIKRKENPALTQQMLRDYKAHLETFTYEERIDKLGLRPDRADVIVPASAIYIQVMEWAQIEEMLVPKVGLADGMVRLMYEKYKKEK